MNSIPEEPNDYHQYMWVFFKRDGLEFFIAAFKFYLALLNNDINAIRENPELRVLFPESDEAASKVHQEAKNISLIIEWLEKELGPNDNQRTDFEITITHGTIRYLKAAGILYVKKLRAERDRLSAGNTVSKYTIEEIDSRITRYEEILGSGVFSKASLKPFLLRNTSFKEGVRKEEIEGPTTEFVAMNPPPVVTLESIEIFDPQIRARCMDLFHQFSENGEHDRLDMIVSEATKILEDRLRKRSEFPKDKPAQKLASHAFNPNSPVLKVSDVPSEQTAILNLFNGVFGFIRNGVHHNIVEDLSPQRVLQIVGMVDYLVSVCESAEKLDLEEDGI